MPPDQTAQDAASGPLRITPSLVIPAHELAWRFSRSSGPGGQGVNTADSRVELTFDVAGSPTLPPELRARALERLGARLTNGRITIAAAEFRSQLRNRQAARERLAATLAQAIAPPPRKRRATKPSKGAVARRLADKTRRSDIKRLRRLPPE
jgi:ribosome-associated protein